MKKLISGLVIGGILATGVCTYAQTASWTANKASFKVMVRGEEFISENPAIVVEGRTYLPLRAMGDALGVSVDWNAELRQAEVAMSEKEPETGDVKAPVQQVETAVTSWTATKASFKVMVRGTEFVSENPPIVVEGRTYLPLRALGEALGVPIDWNEALRQAEVDMKSTVPDATPVVSTTPTSQVTSGTSTTPAPQVTPVPTTKISEADTISVTIASVEAKAGEIVEIPVDISNLSDIGISTADLKLIFDTDNLEFVEVLPGEIVTNAGTNFAANFATPDPNATPDPKATPKPSAEPEKPTIHILFLDYTMTSEAILSNGVFATIRLKVKDDAKAGESLIETNGKMTFGDPLLSSMRTEFVAGKITIVE